MIDFVIILTATIQLHVAERIVDRLPLCTPTEVHMMEEHDEYDGLYVYDDNGNSAIYIDESVPPEYFKATVAHECGHDADSKLNKPAFFGKPPFISDYEPEDADEDFAESYAAYVLGFGQHLSDKKRKYFEHRLYNSEAL